MMLFGGNLIPSRMAFIAHPLPFPNPHRQRSLPPTCKLPEEPSKPLPTVLPPALHNTTLYHVLNTPTPLILALSCKSPWLRARHLRTAQFVKNRPSRYTARGIGALPKRLFVYGKKLPWKISPRDLVTFGRTALKDVLTDGALVDERGTEVVDCDRGWLLTGVRGNGIEKCFVVDCTQGTRRVTGLPRFEGSGISVSGGFVAVVGRERGIMRLFGGTESVVLVMDKDGSVVAKVPVKGTLSSVMATDIPGGVRVLGQLVVGAGDKDMNDIRSGVIFKDGGDVTSSLVTFDIVGEPSAMRTLGNPEIGVMDVAKGHEGGNGVYVGYNRVSNRVGLYDIDGHCWEIQRGESLSGALYSPDGGYLSVLLTGGEELKMLFFESADIENGPVAEVLLEGLDGGCSSVDGVWTDWEFEWSQENAKIVKSAYELFQEKDWNDIESGFSSLGV